MKKTVFFLLPLLIVCKLSSAQVYISKDSIFQLSQKENKPVFLVFSGSDWCANCIRFEKNILNDSTFQSFLNQNLLYLSADFPQRKKLPESLRKQNESLAEQYNPEGIFPSIIVLTTDNKVISIPYQKENAVVFTDKLRHLLETIRQKNGTQN